MKWVLSFSAPSSHCLPSRGEVEQLVERLASGLGVEKRSNARPCKHWYLAVSARVGPQARGVIRKALTSRRELASMRAEDTDGNLQAHVGGEEPIASLARQVLGWRHRGPAPRSQPLRQPHQPQAHLAAGELERRVAADVSNLEMEIPQAHQTLGNEGL